MRLTRPVLGLALAGLLAVSLQAEAAGPKPVAITDLAGDANAINTQGVLTEDPVEVPPVSTGGAQVAGADILGVSWQTLTTTKKVGRKTVVVPNGLQVVMKLAAPAQGQFIFRATAAATGCPTFWFNFGNFATGTKTSSIQHNCPGFVGANATSTTQSQPANIVVAGNTITWTLTPKMLPAGFKIGSKLTELGGTSRSYAGTPTTGGATAPQFDEATGTGTFIYGK